MAKRKVNLIEKVRIGGEGISDEDRPTIEHDRDQLAARNLEIQQALNAYGVQVDVGLEAIAYFRQFLEKIGVITADQRLAAEVMWEHNLNQQLKYSLSVVRQQLAGQQLATPPQGLIVPGR